MTDNSENLTLQKIENKKIHKKKFYEILEASINEETNATKLFGNYSKE